MASASAFSGWERPRYVGASRSVLPSERAALVVAAAALVANTGIVLVWIFKGPYHGYGAEIIAGLVVAILAAVMGASVTWYWRRVALSLVRLEHVGELEEQARRDEVSGLYGLRHLRERLGAEIEHASQSSQECALVVLDLMRFREVNERFGHRAGDTVIAAVGAAIRGVVDGERCIVGRYAGDQFAIVLPAHGRDAAERVAKDACRAVRAISTRATPLNTHIALDAAYAVAVSPQDGGDAESLLAEADRTLVEAKARCEGSASRTEERDAQSVFFAIGDAMRKSLDPQDTVNNLVQAVGSTLGLATCTIWLADGASLEPTAWYTKDKRVIQKFDDIHGSEPITLTEARQSGLLPSKATYVDDIHRATVVPHRFQSLSGPGSWLIHVQLPAPREGLLTMTATHAELAPPSTTLARAIARLAASCIQNADAHQRSERQRDQLAALAGIGGLLFGDGDFETQLGEVVQRIVEVTGCDMLTLDTGDPTGERPFVRQFRAANQDGPMDVALTETWMQMRPALTQAEIVDFLATATEPIVMDDPVNQVPDIYRSVVEESGTQSVVVIPAVWQGEVKGLFYFASFRAQAFDAQDVALMNAIASQLAPALQVAALRVEVAHSYQELKAAHTQALLRLAYAAEARDPYTECHLTRIKALSQAVATRMGIEGDELEALGYGAIVHDLGKLRIPDSILINPGTLSDDEWKTMKRHPEWGAEIIGGNAFYDVAREVALNHHERWDGSGYPRGLKGDEIPLAARIVSVADVYDALTSARPYKTAWPIERALVEMMRMRGKTLCPSAMDTFMALWNEGEVARIDEETLDESLEFDFRSLFAA